MKPSWGSLGWMIWRTNTWLRELSTATVTQGEGLFVPAHFDFHFWAGTVLFTVVLILLWWNHLILFCFFTVMGAAQNPLKVMTRFFRPGYDKVWYLNLKFLELKAEHLTDAASITSWSKCHTSPPLLSSKRGDYINEVSDLTPASSNRSVWKSSENIHSLCWHWGLVTPCFDLLQPTNDMNSSLTSLYRKDQPAVSCASNTTDPPPSAETLVSTGGWFIDKGRGPEKSKILIDLCEEEPDNTALQVMPWGGLICPRIWNTSWHCYCWGS